MSKLYKTPGIVIRKSNFSDHHKVVTIYTKHYGKVSAIARGVRKTKSKLAPHLEIGMHSDFMFAKGKKLDTITSVKCQNPYKTVREDLSKTATLFFICELVNKVTEDNHTDYSMFKLTNEMLMWLDAESDKEKQKSIIAACVSKILKLSGYAPDLYNCLNCSNVITPDNNKFSIERGGLICHKCNVKNTKHITNESIKALRFFDKSKESSRLKLSSQINNELYALLTEYTQYITAKPINTHKLIHNIAITSR